MTTLAIILIVWFAVSLPIGILVGQYLKRRN